MGPQHGYGIARRIEQTTGHLLSLNYGTLYPALLKLEQEGPVAGAWGVSETTARRSPIALRGGARIPEAAAGHRSRRACLSALAAGGQALAAYSRAAPPFGGSCGALGATPPK
jgi:hypothetical protein